MQIQWLGHSCFRFTEKQLSVLTDPFNKDIGLRPPKIKEEIVLVTHDHYDHSEIKDAPSTAVIINGPGEYETQGVYVRGIFSYHDNLKGVERGLNTIYVFKVAGMTFCHLGDLGQLELDEDQVEAIGDVDVLFVPVGGVYTIDGKEATKIIAQIEPKIIVPMHYKVKDLKIDLEGPEKFLKEIGLAAEKVDKFSVNKNSLPQEEMQLIQFDL
ncbi:MAG: hypothetical protein COV31_02875 [Candidatus Yanofskybacteria bacterium CG10_big_fil_rev_8_21_14_0_10_46_23]|uniref:Lactamase n=1 Tax=Candidatus Yanofskybacteria bacterium CG10_big_fil_rev_8_21_14_0_10_46_23 TaxID=1975098 RepID=A0A2H0R3E8_9BACT|nr:MAG: hypothetical protein COV31_02875 [Candidatus Yanofskybacteria bacterium CG10_big_fil_rev_8_21_14_0_10_46_23]